MRAVAYGNTTLVTLLRDVAPTAVHQVGRHFYYTVAVARALRWGAAGLPTRRAVSSTVDKWQKKSPPRMEGRCPRLCCDA